MPHDETMGALFTDFYELTMAQVYFAEGMEGQAVFETFFRRLPEGRSYFVSAGLADVLDFLERFRFHDEDIEVLRKDGRFSEPFLEHLRGLRFTGDVWAIPEGSVVFPHEPIVQIVAPIEQGQLVETFVLNRIHQQTVLATKAARVVDAAEGKTVVEFGARRAYGWDAALQAARCAYLAGASGTSLVEATRRFGIPSFGTMAHSFIQAFDSEAEAFSAFARRYPHTTLLVDTYDSLEGVDRVIRLCRTGIGVGAVRLDSGDLGELARAARRRLDAAGLRHVRIVATSGLDEWKIAKLVREGSPIDAFGVGTSLVTSEDAPTVDLAYKLVEYEGRGRTKLSPGKEIYPMRKQVFRQREGSVFTKDVLGLSGEEIPGEALLVPVMRGGERLPEGRMDLETSRRRLREQLAALPPTLRSLDGAAGLPLRLSPGLERARRAVRSALATGKPPPGAGAEGPSVSASAEAPSEIP